MMHSRNALLIFSRTPEISRGSPGEPFAALSWEDLDALDTAATGDIVAHATQLTDVELLVYRNREEISDDFFLPHKARIQFRELLEGPLPGQILHAVDDAFTGGYHRVVVLLDHQPLLSAGFLRTVFTQLGHEEDCVVVGPGYEGRCYLVGMNVNHSAVFDPADGDPLQKPLLLLKRLCSLNILLFLLNPRYSMDSTASLVRLKNELAGLDYTGGAEAPVQTHEIFRILDKKYKLKK
jgi:glycosyltransferase A (GT-A) superfamily protein (DUF2064 family)